LKRESGVEIAHGLATVATFNSRQLLMHRRDLMKQGVWLGASCLAGNAFAQRDAVAQGIEVPANNAQGVVLNDRQSQLNATRVARVVAPESLEQFEAAIRQASKEGKAISVAGGRHAMGGQQLGDDTVHFDTTKFNKVVKFDRETGRITVEAGIQWLELLDYLQKEQTGTGRYWTFRQKQTGVDHVTIGGTLSANAHGRGLSFPPFVSDLESFTLIDAAGKVQQCSRQENSELFSLAAGGYGLFGVVGHVVLRLVPRTKVERVVKVIPVKDLLGQVEQRVVDGFLYGDCQYSTDFSSDTEPHLGVFSCYRPVGDDAPIPAAQRKLTAEDWGKLLYLGHTDKGKAFAAYSDHYLATNGQIYWSDLHQLSYNFDNYHVPLDQQLGAKHRGTEMITEVYVRRENLSEFLRAARKDVVEHGINLIYGTIRFIERDAETFLAWAQEQSVCVLCNLHVDHTEAGLQKAATDARRLIGRAIDLGGRYFPTYHRWASREQVLKAYPQLPDFLRLKRKYDPDERFQSTWYRFYKTMFA
jgi:FAD/FMN-containing dehydrogenase